MKRLLAVSSMAGLAILLLSLGLVAWASPAPATASKSLTGSVTAVDAVGGTVAVARRGTDLLLYRTTASKIRKNGVPGTLQNVAVGDKVTGSYEVVAGVNQIRALNARTPKAGHASGKLTGVSARYLTITNRKHHRVRVHLLPSTLVRVGKLVTDAKHLHLGSHVRVTLGGATAGVTAAAPLAGNAANVNERDDSSDEAKGTVSAVDAAAGTLSVDTKDGTLDFVTDGSTVINKHDVQTTLDQVQVGEEVEVHYSTDDSGVNLAVTIDVEDSAEQHDSELHGIITEVGSDSLTVAGESDSEESGGSTVSTTVLVNAGTVIIRNEAAVTLTDLQPGDRVEVKYHLEGDAATADFVKAEAGEGDQLEGTITAVDAVAGTITVSGEDSNDSGDSGVAVGETTVVVTDSTRIVRNDQDVALADLQVGDEVEVRYHTDGTTVTADSIHAESGDDHPDATETPDSTQTPDSTETPETTETPDNSN